MALADLAAFKGAIATPEAKNSYRKESGALSAGSADGLPLMGLWLEAPDAGAVPSTAAVCDSSTVGGMRRVAGRTTGSIITKIYDAGGEQYLTSGALIGLLVDRLAHQGGLSGNTAAAQTTNLPTAALTRYTSGVGVMAAVEGYVATGATDILSISCSYTNQAGTPGQTGSTFVGGTAFRDPQVYMFCPQAADSGVRSVESVTLANASGTVGNFGVTLLKPLAIIPPTTFGLDRTSITSNQIIGWNAGIHADACLQVLWMNASTLALQSVPFHMAIETHSV